MFCPSAQYVLPKSSICFVEVVNMFCSFRGIKRGDLCLEMDEEKRRLRKHVRSSRNKYRGVQSETPRCSRRNTAVFNREHRGV